MTAFTNGRPVCAWYGDDFTGTLAVLEIFAFAGLYGAAFLKMPTADEMLRFEGLDVIGLAGTARAQSPEWMDTNLPTTYRWLAATGAEIVAYKACSTLDSAPGVGSIGHAAELGLTAFSQSSVDCLIACPSMGRYQVFGNLFATGPDGAVHRLDRHPVMTRHPVTPMHEADVARHLAAQTMLQTVSAHSATTRPEIDGIICLDAYNAADMERTGAAIWSERGKRRFVIGSQGVQVALVAHFRKKACLPPRLRRHDPSRVRRWSFQARCRRQRQRRSTMRLPMVLRASASRPDELLPGSAEAASQRATASAKAILNRGRMPIIFSATGPDDPAVAAFGELVRRQGHAPQRRRNIWARRLGKWRAVCWLKPGSPVP
nr:four-carbon acid sugar kinase family protein [Marinicella sp. W31]MDC2875587.1 four-carbon acid sugar kinase family protein [Marinicella sp. W31]